MEKESYIAKYLNAFIEEQGNIENCRLIFRGHANDSWNVVSAAGRRLKDEKNNKNKKVTQSEFIRYHVNLIANAKEFGYGDDIKSNSKLSDVELLAGIQHYGGATCLVDFSTNFLIALWFATYKSPMTAEHAKYKAKNLLSIPIDKLPKVNDDADGKVIWIDLLADENYSKITYYNDNKSKKEKSIQKLLTRLSHDFESRQKKIEPCFWLWEPTKLNNRIIKQDSVFIFGLPAFVKENKKEEDEYTYKISTKGITIKSEDKPFIRNELEKVFGINAETIFYDFTGFANNANGADIQINNKLLSKSNCMANAKENIKKELYSLAISHIDEAISCIGLKKYDKCNKTCNLKTDKSFICGTKGTFLYWRAVSNQKLKRIDEALINYFEAEKELAEAISKLIKEFSSDINNIRELIDDFTKTYNLLCECIRNQSSIFYENLNYEKALSSEENLKSFYTETANQMEEINLLLHENNIDIHLPKLENGIDTCFTILELSILNNKPEQFFEYSKIAKEALGTNKSMCKYESDKYPDIINDIKKSNGGIVHYFLDTLGNSIFNQNVNRIIENNENKFIEIVNRLTELIQSAIDQSGKDDEPNLMMEGYYYWSFTDIINWIKHFKERTPQDKTESFTQKNADLLLLITKKTEEAQNTILKHIFDKSAAVRMNIFEK